MPRRLRLHPARLTSARFSPRRVAAAFAIIVVVLAVGRVGDGERAGRAGVELTDAALLDSLAVLALNDFGAFIVARNADRSARLDHARTADGLRRLATALDAVLLRVAADTVDSGVVPAALRDDAELLRAARPPQRAAIARDAFVRVSDAMAELQRHQYAHLERAVAEVSEAAGAVRADTTLVAQRELVLRFFERAYDVLRAMAEPGG